MARENDTGVIPLMLILGQGCCAHAHENEGDNVGGNAEMTGGMTVVTMGDEGVWEGLHHGGGGERADRLGSSKGRGHIYRKAVLTAVV